MSIFMKFAIVVGASFMTWPLSPIPRGLCCYLDPLADLKYQYKYFIRFTVVVVASFMTWPFRPTPRGPCRHLEPSC